MVRAIGVSNFMMRHLTRPSNIARSRTSTPTTASSIRPNHPSGGITYYRDRGLNGALEDPVIGSIARAHGESPAQVVLRWGLHQGPSVIPKSTKPGRMAENLDVFDFQLTDEQLAALDALQTGRRGGREPEDVTLAASGKPIPET
jgi:diketogulonate reductase-like aldo/keto reductase